MDKFANEGAMGTTGATGAIWLAVGKVLEHQKHAPALTPMPHGSRVPLSFAQARLWFLCCAAPKSPVYTIPFAWRVRGELDVKALEQTFTAMIKRHEILRTNFKLEDGVPLQVIAPSRPFRVSSWNLEALAPEIRDAAVHAALANEARIPYDLERDALLRVSLFRTAPAEHVLLLLVHHIIFDGWSLGVLLQELTLQYRAFRSEVPAALPPVQIQYADFSLWQREWLSGTVLQEQLSFWKKHLKDAPPMLEVRGDRSRPTALSGNGACHYFELAPELLERAQALRKAEEVSLFSMLLAGFYLLLYRHTGQADIVVGSPAANRSPLATRNMLGFFINMLPLRMKLSAHQPFRSLLRAVAELTASAFAHQFLPFQTLVRELKPSREPGRTPVFQSCFVFQTLPRLGLNLAGAESEAIPVDTRTAKFDLTLDLREQGSTVNGFFEYSTDLFSSEFIRRMEWAYQRLLRAAVTAPHHPIGTLPLPIHEFVCGQTVSH